MHASALCEWFCCGLQRADGLKFFFSKNNVILTSGIDGIIPPRYFARAVERLRDGSMVDLPLTADAAAAAGASVLLLRWETCVGRCTLV